MFKKSFYPMLVGAVVAAAVCLASFNAVAEKQQFDPYSIKTDASERTMIKEILENQKTIIALLNEIKAAL